MKVWRCAGCDRSSTSSDAVRSRWCARHGAMRLVRHVEDEPVRRLPPRAVGPDELECRTAVTIPPPPKREDDPLRWN